MCVQFTMGHDAMYERDCRVGFPAVPTTGELGKQKVECRNRISKIKGDEVECRDRISKVRGDKERVKTVRKVREGKAKSCEKRDVKSGKREGEWDERDVRREVGADIVMCLSVCVLVMEMRWGDDRSQRHCVCKEREAEK